MNSFINKSEIFDFIRNSYARINCSDFIEKRGIFFPPVRYFLELTHLCNLNCQYCYIGSDRLKDELTTRQWQDVINQIPFWAFITIVGGEPLIREDFRDILYLAAEKTLGKVNLVTNGLLLNDEIIDAIIDSKMLLLSVSIDGWGKNHDKYRGKEGIFDKIINNLENLSQRVIKGQS